MRYLKIIHFMVLVFLIIPFAQAAWTPGRTEVFMGGGWRMQHGDVLIRDLVKGENNQPIFAEFDKKGQVVRIIGEAIGDLEHARVLSGNTYRQWMQRYQQLLQTEAGQDAITYSKSRYQAAENLGMVTIAVQKEDTIEEQQFPIPKPNISPTTHAVMVRNPQQIIDPRLLNGREPILLEMPFDPSSPIPGEDAKALLIDKTGQIITTSAVNIGYRSAFLKPKGDFKKEFDYLNDASRDDDVFFKPWQVEPWKPVVGAKVQTYNFYPNEITATNDKGEYSLNFWLPMCPGFYKRYTYFIDATLLYRNFNPRDSEMAFFTASDISAIDCFGMGAGSEEAPSIGIYEVGSTQAAATEYMHITVDAHMLSGIGWLSNDGDDQIPITDKTEYEYSPFVLPDEAAKVIPDFRDQGLIKTISGEDFAKTDLYIYRVSNGQMLSERQGLRTDEYIRNEQNDYDEKSSLFYYNMLFRGNNTGTPQGSLLEFQEQSHLNKELHGHEADHLRTGEQIQIIAINRPTGYIASVITTLKNSAESGIMDFEIPPLVLRPPNLKVSVKRQYKVDAGLTKDQQREYLVGFEGSGLSSDQIITLTTEWYNHDDTLLPNSLPGYTGQFAKVVGQYEVGRSGDLSWFSIKPGKNIQVVRLPQEKHTNDHFYLWVNGEPKSRYPNFSTNNDALGPLKYRPKQYVPVKVAFFDERRTQADAVTRINNIRNKWTPANPLVLDKIKPAYRWFFRPEMQYSLWDFKLQDVKIENIYDSAQKIHNSKTDIRYDLNVGSLDPLPRFGGERRLRLGFGVDDLIANPGADLVVSYNDIIHQYTNSPAVQLEYLPDANDRLEPEDYLAVQFYQEDDFTNLLFEYVGLPIINVSTNQKLDLKRHHQLGSFDYHLQNAGEMEITDTYALVRFVVIQSSKVKIQVLNTLKIPVSNLIDEQFLPPGEYYFVLTYQEMKEAGIYNAHGPDFYINVMAKDPKLPGPDDQYNHITELPGELIDDYEGNMLGQTMVHNTLIQDGSIHLQRNDIAFPGRTPNLSFSRTYSNLDRSHESILGQGWSHNLDIHLTAMAYGEDVTAYNLPDWVVKNRKRYLKASEIPETDPPLRMISVSNGGLFKKKDGQWHPQRGRHGSLIEQGGKMVFTSKDGTRYTYDIPRRGITKILGQGPQSTHISTTDTLYKRLGLSGSEIFQMAEPAQKRQVTIGNNTTTSINTIEDRNNNRMNFHYKDDLLTKVDQDNGRNLIFNYKKVNGLDRLHSVIASGNIVLNFQYDKAGLLKKYSRGRHHENYDYQLEQTHDDFNLIKTTDPNGNSTQYQWLGRDQLPGGLLTFVKALHSEDVIAAIEYADGAQVSFGYQVQGKNERTVTDDKGSTRYELNFHGNPDAIHEPLGRTTKMKWSLDAGLDDNVMISRTDAKGNLTTYQYDSKGNITLQTDADNKTTNTLWDLKFSIPTSRTDRNGSTTTFQYDSKGNLTTQTMPLGQATSHRYNSQGDRTSTTDAKGFSTQFGYDKYGQVEKITPPRSHAISITYDDRGRKTRQQEGEHITTYGYDNLDNLTSETDPQKNTLRYIYDDNNNKTSETSKRGLRLSYVYDQRDRVKNISRSDSASRQFQYDKNGNLTNETDWLGNATRHIYNALNQRHQSTDPEAGKTSFGYDLVGNQNSITNAEGNTTTTDYDVVNRPITILDPLNNKIVKQYDGNGNLTDITDPRGATTHHEYDANNRKVKTTDAKNNPTVLDYDDNNNLIKITDAKGNITTHEYDEQNRKTKSINALNHSTQMIYDNYNNLIQTIDAKGNITNTEHDVLNRPIKITDAQSYTTTLQYDADSNKIQETDANDNSRTWQYDTLNQLILSKNALNGVITRDYDFNGNLEKITDAKGNSSVIEYDKNNLPVKTTEAFGTLTARSTEKHYDKVGNVIDFIDARGNLTHTEYDKRNLPRFVTDSLGYISENQYDENGNLKVSIDKRKQRTIHEYNELNQKIKTIDAKNQTLIFDYDPVGNLNLEIDKRGTSTQHNHDKLNRLHTTTKAGITLITNDYDANNNPTHQTDANGNTITTQYNARNLAVKTINPDTTFTQTEYDGNGNVIKTIDEQNQTQTIEYDKENQVIAQTNGQGETTKFQYDPNGNKIKTTQPKGNSQSMAYDALDRLIKVTDGLGHITQYQHDSNDNLIKITDAVGNIVDYQYDKLNRRTGHLQHLDGQVITTKTEFDENGNIKQLLDPNGQVITYQYNEINQEIKRQYPNQTTAYNAPLSIETLYDPNNNPIQVTETKKDKNGQAFIETTTFQYDPFDRLTQKTEREHPISYTYDPNGNRTQVTTEGQSTDYTFNPRNQIKTATTDTLQTTYEYYPDTLLKNILYPNGTNGAYTYDKAKRITTIKNNGKDLLSAYLYEFDKNGNRIKQTETQNNKTDVTTYQYDKADRLTQFQLTKADNSIETTEYTLDAVSNRLSEKVTLNSLVITDKTNTYNSLNQVTKIIDNLFKANIEYTYDKNGNTLQKIDNTQTPPVVTQFEYDSRDQLVKVARGPPGNLETISLFGYNFLGQRIRYLLSSRGDVEYFYDGQSVIFEKNITTGNPIARYIFGSQLLSLTTPEGIQYYHFDGLNSTVNLTDEFGNNKVSYNLDPWGHIKEQVGESVNRQIFTGQEHDSKTGLIYFGARYYDPDLPRFINQDSYLGEIVTPPSLNRYTYAYHRPTVYYDPNGHIAWLADLRDSVNNWATERFEASEGLNNTNSYSWLSKGMAGAAGLGAGMAELGALGISTVNYAANQASKGLNKLGIVSDETAAEHTAEVAGTHESLGQVYDAVSTEEGRSRIASSAVDTLGAAMSGDTGALARTTSIFAPVPGAAALGATAKMGKAAVSGIKSSKTVIKAVEKAKAKAGQAISTTVETGKNVAQKVNHVVKKVVNNAMQPGPGSFARQMGSVGNVNTQKFLQNLKSNAQETNFVLLSKTYKNSLPRPKGRSPSGGRLQAHHGLQQQWAKENLSQYGYSADLAPTITIETGKGFPHTAISKLQNIRRDVRVKAGQDKWGSSLQNELQYIVDDFSGAGFSSETIQKVLQQQYKMLDKLNVPYQKIK